MSVVNQNFSGVDWSDSDLTGQSVVNCNFVACDFSSSDFSRSSLVNCTFVSCNLEDACFDRVSITNCTFTSCDLADAQFERASRTNVSFRNCNLDGATGLRSPDMHTDSGPINNSHPMSLTFGDVTVGEVSIGSGNSSNIQVNGSFDFGSSVVGQFNGNSGVHLTSNGISTMPFDPWVHIFNDGHSYRIESSGTKVAVNGSYMFVNQGRFIHTHQNPFSGLTVSVGRVIGNSYDRKTTWELSAGEWCEVTGPDFVG